VNFLLTSNIPPAGEQRPGYYYEYYQNARNDNNLPMPYGGTQFKATNVAYKREAEDYYVAVTLITPTASDGYTITEPVAGRILIPHY
jgi:hypothetical protein